MFARVSYLRDRRGHGGHRVGNAELFFDLVFVFAITQLSHALIAHPSVEGAFETALIFLAVWWAWIYTVWVTNWLDPQRGLVRLLLFVLMAIGLVMSTSIPHAFEDKAATFACAYVAFHLVRDVFMLWALKNHSASNFLNFVRITVWQVVAVLFWIAGIVWHEHRFALWLTALGVETLGPMNAFWTPGLGRSTTADWDVSPAHMAERCSLFIIIALGEGILVTGATFGDQPFDQAHGLAFLVAFAGSVAMWWIYFLAAERGGERYEKGGDPGRLARLAYTYLHAPIVAGIVVSAAGDQSLLSHAEGETSLAAALLIAGGPALFLGGTAAFKSVIFEKLPHAQLIGIGALIVLIAAHQALAALPFAGLAAAILIGVAIASELTARADEAARAKKG